MPATTRQQRKPRERRQFALSRRPQYPPIAWLIDGATSNTLELALDTDTGPYVLLGIPKIVRLANIATPTDASIAGDRLILTYGGTDIQDAEWFGVLAEDFALRTRFGGSLSVGVAQLNPPGPPPLPFVVSFFGQPAPAQIQLQMEPTAGPFGKYGVPDIVASGPGGPPVDASINGDILTLEYSADVNSGDTLELVADSDQIRDNIGGSMLAFSLVVP